MAGRVLRYAALIPLSVVFLAPLVWMLSTSLKPARQLFLLPPIWIPRPVMWENYPGVFQKYPFVVYAKNTLTIAVLTVIGDPKQAIYAFRGADVVSYLAASDTAGARATLATNHRSDAPLLGALDQILGGAALVIWNVIDGWLLFWQSGIGHGTLLGTEDHGAKPHSGKGLIESNHKGTATPQD